jgi:hypothetical protein
MSHTTGYRDITATPSPNLYADHNRERHYPECDTCFQPFTARSKALRCEPCRRLSPKARRELRERLRAAKEQA